MSRLCVIGNSHVVAVREGWRDAGQLAERFSKSFYAAPGELMTDIQLRDGKLVPGSAEARKSMEVISGASEIDPGAFDAFLLVGLHVRLHLVAQIYRTHRLAADAGPNHQVISAGALGAAIAGQIEQTSGIKVASKLKSVTAAPIFLIPEPLPGEIIIEKDDFWAGAFLATIHRFYMEQLRRVTKSYNVELATQAEETITRGGLTKAAYLSGAIRLVNNKLQEKGQWRHMNAQFGAEILREMLPRLVSKLASP